MDDDGVDRGPDRRILVDIEAARPVLEMRDQKKSYGRAIQINEYTERFDANNAALTRAPTRYRSLASFHWLGVGFTRVLAR